VRGSKKGDNKFVDTLMKKSLTVQIIWLSILTAVAGQYCPRFAWAQAGNGPMSSKPPINQPRLVVRARHPAGGPRVATLSQDGRLIVIGSCVRDIATGGEIRCFEGHTGGIRSVAFSPDGQRVATASSDRTTRVWEIATGREVRRFLHPFLPSMLTDDVSEVAFSPDSRFLITNNIKAVYLWDITTGREMWRIKPEGRQVIDRVVFSPTGRFVITAWDYFASDVRLWDTATGKEVRRLINPVAKISVGRLAFSPDEQYVLTGSREDATVRLWEIATGREVQRFEHQADTIYDVAFSSDGRSVLTLTGAKAATPLTLHVWDAATGGPVRRLVTDYKCCQAFFVAAGRFVLGLEGKGLDAQVWDTTTGQHLPVPAPLSLPVDAMTFSPDNHWLILGSHDGELRLWDTTTGRVVRSFANRSSSLAFAPDSHFLLTVGSLSLQDPTKRQNNNFAQLWDVQTGQEVQRFIASRTNDLWSAIGPANEVWSIAFSPNGQLVATGSTDYTVRLWNVATGHELQRFSVGDLPFSIAFSPDEQFLLIVEGVNQGRVILRQVATGNEIWKVQLEPLEFFEAFSADGRVVMLRHDRAVDLLDTATGQRIRRLQYAPYGFGASVIHASPRGRFVLNRNPDGSASFRDFSTGKELRRIENVDWAALSPDEQLMITRSGDTARLWEVASGRELCQLISFGDDTWVVVTPDGRFDTNNLDNNRGLHWIMPDDPLTPLPLEIFMRQYYEPRLLPRILAGEKFTSVPSLQDLNRVQPRVKITKIAPQTDASDTVAVTVEVAKASREFLRDGKKVIVETGVYDLRLFRDGQLVGYAPQSDGELPLDPHTATATHTFTVRLPYHTERREVEFSAYAFNVDQVKSATDRKTFSLPTAVKTRKGRAYVITVGANAYDNPAWDLNFAANDGRRIEHVLHDRLTRSRDYEAVVSIPLISDAETENGERMVTVNRATKHNMRTVLALLAGKPVAPADMQTVPNAEKILPVRPEDVVLLSISSHGHKDVTGTFYFILADTGPGEGRQITAELLQRALSSEELSHWLRDVDGGQLAMIVDACHSAASVEGKDFKPGPMDSRGLGQLAYDKGMRILTASQADDVAVESDLIEQGLLTYALTHDGLEVGQADFKPRDHTITLTEWLEYGVERVPALYEEVKKGPLQTFGQPEKSRGQIVISSPGNNSAKKKTVLQQPSLFDFARKRSDIVLVKKR